MPPAFQAPAFNCPSCGAYAKQLWSEAMKYSPDGRGGFTNIPGTIVALCTHCQRDAIWLNGRMIYPTGGAAPVPSPDMPEDVRLDYEEARSVLSISPRAAAALLRLAVQRLCKHLGEPGENINVDIASLVRKGLPPTIQKALDSLRVAGNNAVHPGQLDIYDDTAIATRLFGLLNVIVDNQITQPRAIAELYDTTVPPNLQQAINNRDTPR